MNVAWLEAPGLLAATAALWFSRSGLDRSGLDRSGLDRSGLDRSGLGRSGLGRSGIADVSLRALLLLLAFNHACNLLEALGVRWADTIADQVSLIVPLLWGLFLLESGRQYLSERLQASDDQVRFFLENVPAAVAWLDAQSRLLGHSRSWAELFGEAKLGAPLTHGVQLPALQRAIAECASGTAESLTGEETFEQEKPSTFRWAVRSWRHPDRPAPGVLLLLEDISEQREAEAQRLAAADELSRTQRLAEVGQLAAGAAHDFNNFLQIINNSLDELEHDAAAKVEALANIAGAVQSASAMTRAMLQFGQRREEKPQQVDLCALIAQLQSALAQALGRRHRLVVSVPEGQAVAVWGNPRRLEQALLNLTMNARDAMPRGGAIELVLDKAEGLAQISVRDSGIGMAEDVRAQLFTPFFTTKGTRGTGLGLRVVKTAMDEHRGSVSVDSTPGRGTTFRLRIPLFGVPSESVTP